MNVYINGWNRESMMKKLEEFNGFEVCGEIGGSCYYRKEGNSCFAGVFIPDDKYKSSFEDTTIDGLFSKFPELNLREDMPLRDMLSFQKIHDDYKKEDKLSLKERVIEFLDKLESR